MSGVAPWPVELRIRRGTRRLELDFDDGQSFDLPVSLLRAMTPSAAERGHGAAPDTPLARNFDAVSLIEVQPVGAYAVRLVFDDGHDTGLYTWAALHRIGRDKDRLSTEHRRVLQNP